MARLTPIVLELLGAVVDLDARPSADVLVVGTLVGILKPAPAADVVDEDRFKLRVAAPGVVDHLFQGASPFDS
jgi:hypothetical protein